MWSKESTLPMPPAPPPPPGAMIPPKIEISESCHFLLIVFNKLHLKRLMHRAILLYIIQYVNTLHMYCAFWGRNLNKAAALRQIKVLQCLGIEKQLFLELWSWPYVPSLLAEAEILKSSETFPLCSMPSKLQHQGSDDGSNRASSWRRVLPLNFGITTLQKCFSNCGVISFFLAHVSKEVKALIEGHKQEFCMFL